MSSRLAWKHVNRYTIESVGLRFAIRNYAGTFTLIDRASNVPPNTRDFPSEDAAKRLANGLLDTNERL